MKDAKTVDAVHVDESRWNAAIDAAAGETRRTIIEPMTDDAEGTFYLRELTTAEAVSAERIGSLVSVTGYIRKIEFDENGEPGAICVDDGSGEIVLFLDGYIHCDDGCVQNENGYHDLGWMKEGLRVTARGIASVGQTGFDTPEKTGPRIRLRSRADLSEACRLYGDADCNGRVDTTDAAEVLRALVGLSTLSEEGMRNADVCAVFDELPNAADAAAILRRAMGLIDRFEAENAQ
jgi:hypothetical protein